MAAMMPLVETRYATDWRDRLGPDEGRWRRGRPALEAAVSWDGAARRGGGLPPEVGRVLSTPRRKAELLLAVAGRAAADDGAGAGGGVRRVGAGTRGGRDGLGGG